MLRATELSLLAVLSCTSSPRKVEIIRQLRAAGELSEPHLQLLEIFPEEELEMVLNEDKEYLLFMTQAFADTLSIMDALNKQTVIMQKKIDLLERRNPGISSHDICFQLSDVFQIGSLGGPGGGASDSRIRSFAASRWAEFRVHTALSIGCSY